MNTEHREMSTTRDKEGNFLMTIGVNSSKGYNKLNIYSPSKRAS